MAIPWRAVIVGSRLVEERKKRFEAEREKERKEHEELLKFDVVRKEVVTRGHVIVIMEGIIGDSRGA